MEQSSGINWTRKKLAGYLTNKDLTLKDYELLKILNCHHNYFIDTLKDNVQQTIYKEKYEKNNDLIKKINTDIRLFYILNKIQ